MVRQWTLAIALGGVVALPTFAILVWYADAWILSLIETVTIATWLAGCLAILNSAPTRRAIASGAVVAAGFYWLLTMGPWFSERIGPSLLTSTALQSLDSWARGRPDLEIPYVYTPVYEVGGHWDKGWGREEPDEMDQRLAFAQGVSDPSISQAVAHWALVWGSAGAGGVAGWLLWSLRNARNSAAPVRVRISLRQLMGVVTFTAFACGMLVHADDWGATTAITITCLLLVVFVIALLVSQYQQRVFACGWLLFSVAYLAAVLGPWASRHIGPKLLTTRFLVGVESMRSESDKQIPEPSPDLNLNFTQTSFTSTTRRIVTFEPPERDETEAGMYSSFQSTGHWLLTIAFGYVGGFIACQLARARQSTHSPPDA